MTILVIWFRSVLYGLFLFGMVWFNMVWFHLEWYGKWALSKRM